MTPHQRVRAALEHRAPDRTPYFEYVLLSPVADALLGRRYTGDPVHWPELVAECGWEEAVRRNAADRLDLALRLGHDLLYATPNPPPPSPPAALAPQDSLPDDPVERLRWRNAQATGHPPPPDETFAVHVRLLELMQERGVDLPLLVPAYGHGVWTDTDLMQTMLLAPEVAEEHFALATRRSLDRCGCEVDGYLEIDRYAGMELRRLKTEYGEKVCLIGNLDCGNTLSFGTPERIRQETLDCLEAGRGGGGHILCASNAITASVPLENYLAVVHAYREWCGLPALGLER